MKLSTAMMLGSVTCKMEAGNINSCGIGCALNAHGVSSVGVFNSWERYDTAYRLFPWLKEIKFTDDWGFTCSGIAAVYSRFDGQVCTGLMTLEQLVDYVRSIEPSCGECNKFDCTCVKSEAVPAAESVLA